MKTAIVNKANDSIVTTYDGHADQSKYGGPWGDVSAFVHVELGDIDPGAAIISQGSDGTYAVAEDSAKASAIATAKTLSTAIALAQTDRNFGDSLVTKFTAENRILGITGSGKSGAVLTVMGPIMSALDSGSLDVAVAIMKAIPSASKDSTFITNARILSYVNAIETHLGETLSTSLA